ADGEVLARNRLGFRRPGHRPRRSHEGRILLRSLFPVHERNLAPAAVSPRLVNREVSGNPKGPRPKFIIRPRHTIDCLESTQKHRLRKFFGNLRSHYKAREVSRQLRTEALESFCQALRVHPNWGPQTFY